MTTAGDSRLCTCGHTANDHNIGKRIPNMLENVCTGALCPCVKFEPKEPRRCPYCRVPEPNHVIGMHNCVHHDCPACGTQHHRNLTCEEAGVSPSIAREIRGTIVPADPSAPSPEPRIALHTPVVEDHGIFAEHDVACPVCWMNPAMLCMNNGVFWPCDTCRADGWETVRFRWPRVQRWFHRNRAMANRRKRKVEA